MGHVLTRLKELNVARDLILVSQVLKRGNELNVIPRALTKFVQNTLTGLE